MTSAQGATPLGYGLVVAGVAGQPVFRVAKDLAEHGATRGRAVSVSGNPDARPGRGIEAHAQLSDHDPMAPLVMPGECQLIIGLEPLEAMRTAAKYYTPNIRVISLTEQLPPTTVMHKGEDYPDMAELADELGNAGSEVTWIDGAADEGGLQKLLEASQRVVTELLTR